MPWNENYSDAAIVAHDSKLDECSRHGVESSRKKRLVSFNDNAAIIPEYCITEDRPVKKQRSKSTEFETTTSSLGREFALTSIDKNSR